MLGHFNLGYLDQFGINFRAALITEVVFIVLEALIHQIWINIIIVISFFFTRITVMMHQPILIFFTT